MEVVAAAGRKSDDQIDGLATIELLDGLRSRRLRRNRRQRESDQTCKHAC